MKTKIEKILEEATIKTFEDICFMYLEPELKDSQAALEPDAAAEVEFHGAYNGRLVIASRGGLFSAIASNILSSDHPTLQEKKMPSARLPISSAETLCRHSVEEKREDTRFKAPDISAGMNC